MYKRQVVRHLVYFGHILWRGKNTDIIFAQDPVSVGIPSALAALLLRKKFIVKIVGDYAWEQGVQRFGAQDLLDDFLGKRYGWRIELLRRIQKFTASRAELIIVPSRYLQNVIIRWGTDSHKIVVIYNSLERSLAEISKNEARQNLGLSGKILISAGRLVHWKGFEALIDTMPQVLQNVPNGRLFILGSGPLEEKLREKIEFLRLGDNIELLGPVARPKFLRYLRAGDIFILNTAYEGFSHTILEAMAAGVPVITTPSGGNTEIIEDGINGLFVSYNSREELKQAVVELCFNPDLREKLTKNSQKSLEKFGKEKMIEDTIKVLEDL